MCLCAVAFVTKQPYRRKKGVGGLRLSLKGYREGPLEGTLNLISLYNPYICIYTSYSPYIPK